MIKKYLYNNIKYDSIDSVRQAVWETEYKIFGKPESDEDWKSLGIVVINSQDRVSRIEVRSELDLEELKQTKRGLLNDTFNYYINSHKTFFTSSLGFNVNANSLSFENVSGLIIQLQYNEGVNENPQIQFRTFDDEMVTLTIAELKRIQYEMSLFKSNLYHQKWNFHQQIDAAENEQDLNDIDIVFSNTNFFVDD